MRDKGGIISRSPFPASSAIIILAILTTIFSGVKETNVGQVKGEATIAPLFDSDKIDIFYGPTGLFSYEDMFKALKATVYPEDKYIGFPPPELGQGSIIKVYRAMSVNVTDANEKKVYRTWQKTIEELINEKGLELGNQDVISPEKPAKLIRDMDIVITRVSETDMDEFEPIKYKTIKENTRDLERGITETKQKGENGKLKKTYHIRRENGKEVSKKLIGKEVIKESVDEILLIGTGPKLISSGKYKDQINEACKKYDLDAPILYNLMIRESNGNYNSVNPDGPYTGLFQYTDGAWVSMSSRSGYSGASIYDVNAQINVTAWAITHGYKSKWPSLK